MTINSYWSGNLVTISFTVMNQAVSPPVPADPTTITLAFAPPGGTSTEYTWPIGGGQIVHDGTGLFHAELDTTGSDSGTWRVEVVTTGVQTANVHIFQSTALPFPI